VEQSRNFTVEIHHSDRLGMNLKHATNLATCTEGYKCFFSNVGGYGLYKTTLKPTEIRNIWVGDKVDWSINPATHLLQVPMSLSGALPPRHPHGVCLFIAYISE